jgi:hypothetical protein
LFQRVRFHGISLNFWCNGIAHQSI